MFIVYSVLVLFNFLFALLPFLIRKVDRNTISFSVVTFCISAWCVSIYYCSVLNTVWCHRFAFFWMSWVPLSLLIFILSYPRPRIRFNFFRYVSFSIVPFFVALLSFTPYIVSHVSVKGIAIFSWGQPIYMIYTLVYISVILGFTFRGILSYSGQDRVALRIFFNGLLLALVFASLTNLVLPFWAFYNFIFWVPC